MNAAPSYQAREGIQLCVVYFLKPASDGSRTVVQPVDSLRPLEVAECKDAFRFCFAEFPQATFDQHNEATPFEERLAQTGMFYLEGDIKSIDKYAAEPGSTRATVERLVAVKCDNCIKIKNASDHHRFPFFDHDYLLHTVRTVNLRLVPKLTANPKRIQHA